MSPDEWQPQFKPHKNVIDLLVGSQLYTSADAAIRELIQNAEDACILGGVGAERYAPAIEVNYSPSANWCEVGDNGLGMNREAIESSFAAIGAPKSEVAHLRERINQLPTEQRQIGQFGIGILSCFGVASTIEIHTKMDGHEPISLRVTDFHTPFAVLPPSRTDRGTTIKLTLKPDGPMKASDVPAAVQKYVRHAQHVRLVDIDAMAIAPVNEKWIDMPPDSIRVDLERNGSLLGGRVALDAAWVSLGHGFGAEVVTCNAGFLVSERDRDLFPAGATGFRGELDLAPGALTILMSREGFQRDEKWKALSDELGRVFGRLVDQLLETYERILAEGSSTDAVERGVLLLTKSAARGALPQQVLTRIDALLPRAITLNERGRVSRFTLRELKEKAGTGGTVYYVREDQNQPQRKRSFADDSGSSFQVTENLSTVALRTLTLQSAGHTVVSCNQRSIQFATAVGAQQWQGHEFDILSQYAQSEGFAVVSVSDAPAELVELNPLPESELLNNVLDAGEGIRIVALPSSSSRVIFDFSGRLLNASHPDVQALMRVIPAAAGNPVLRTLIQAYVDIDNLEYRRASDRLKTLLEDPDLSEKAQLTTSPHLRAYLERRLRALAWEKPKS